MINTDAAASIYHFMEVIKNGTLNIPDWNHTTTLELDSAFLFAVPVYYITHDMFKALVIANSMFIVLYLYVIYQILRIGRVSVKWTVVTLFLVLTPWSLGMLDYFNMLFYQTSQYTVKTLTPLTLLLLLLWLKDVQPKNKRHVALFAFTFILYTILLFSTALSTGIYTMLCGILPIFIGTFYADLCNGRAALIKKKTALMGYTMLVFVLGYVCYEHLYPMQSKYNLNITLVADFFTNFRANFLGFFQIFGAIPTSQISGMSLDGIILCMKFLFCILLLFCMGKGIKRLDFTKEQNEWLTEIICIVLMNIFILMIYDTRYGSETMQYRYYIIMVVPLLLVLGYQLQKWEERMNRPQKITLNGVLFLCLLLMLYGNNKLIFDNLHSNDYALEFCEYFDSMDVESVIFVNDPVTAALCRGIDNTKKYGSYSSEEQKFYTQICTYQAASSGSYYGNEHVLAIVKDTALTEYFSEDIAREYQKVGTVRWMDIYYCNHAVIF